LAKVISLPRQIAYLFFPRRCCCCGKVVPPGDEICADCLAAVSKIAEPACRHCGRGIAECVCREHKNFYSAVASPFYYEGPARNCIRRLKFSGKTGCAQFLGREMARAAQAAFGDKAIDIAAFVPMSKKEIKARGYNQSRYLAQAVARELRLDFSEELLVKLYETRAQRTLKAGERAGNLAGVFDVAESERVKGKTILLCDDVITTGTTLNECARMLLLSGADAVFCLTAAATKMKNH